MYTINETLDGLFHVFSEITIVVGIVFLLLTEFFSENIKSKLFFIVALLTLGVCLTYEGVLLTEGENLIERSYFNQLFHTNGFLIVTRILILFSSLIGMCFYYFTLTKNTENKHRSEIYILMFGITLGSLLTLTASNAISLFLGLECTALSSYLLVAAHKGKWSAEGGIKYFIYGAFSTGLMLFGLSWLYIITHSMDVFANKWFIAFMQFEHPVKWIALVLFLASLLFKVSIFPFYKWVPDVYEGSAWYVLSYISTVPKIAAWIWLIEWSRVFEGATLYFYIWVFLSIVTMVISNTAAIGQHSLKRLMAYSTVAQMGFVSMLLIGGGKEAFQSAFYYLMVYSISVPILYYILHKFEEETGSKSIEDLNGTGKHNPIMGAIMILVLSSLVGLPITGGFFGKLFVFSSVYSNYQAFEFTPLLWVIFVGGVSTVISLYYYLKIPYAMFINGSKESLRILTWNSQFDSIFVFLLSILVVGMFFMPQKMMNFLQLLISYL